MTEMMDLTSDLVGTGIPFLDYKSYAERIFFPGHRESPLQRDLDIPECRRQTVEQGLVQLSNLLNSKLFLTKVRSLFLLAECNGVWAVLLAGRGQCSLKFLPDQPPLQHPCLQEPLGGTALFSGGSHTALSLSLHQFIHTLEIQRTFSPRDRAYVASLLTVSLHGKLEYFTDILKTLLNDLVEQYVAKNPKLMLRR